MDSSQKHASEAESAGLELLGRCEDHDANYRRYRAVSCGHEMDLQVQHVRRNNWKCSDCFISEVTKLGSDLGMIYLGKSARNGAGLYLLPCGHTRVKSFAQLRNGDDYCTDCFVDSIKSNLRSKSFSFIKQVGSRTTCICDLCGTESSFQTGSIADKRFECKGCFVTRWKEEAEVFGLEYLGAGDTSFSSLYKLPCDCIRSLRRDHVRENIWACDKCELQGRFNKSGHVYLLRITSGAYSWLKLGFSNNVNFRIEAYGLPSDSVAEVLSTVNFDTCYEALAFEKELHRKFKSLRLDKKFMKQYHTIGGHTECYPLSSLDCLLKELDAKR